MGRTHSCVSRSKSRQQTLSKIALRAVPTSPRIRSQVAFERCRMNAILAYKVHAVFKHHRKGRTRPVREKSTPLREFSTRATSPEQGRIYFSSFFHYRLSPSFSSFLIHILFSFFYLFSHSSSLSHSTSGDKHQAYYRHAHPAEHRHDNCKEVN